MNKNIPTIIKETEGALRCNAPKVCHTEHEMALRRSSTYLITLLRAIEEGKWVIVPCEATDEMINTATYAARGLAWPKKSDMIRAAYKAAISAAPTEAILNEMFGEKQ